MSTMICSVYRSSKDSAMYLYVDKKEDLARVPADLLQRFGKPALAMTLALTPERKLARASAVAVLAAIETQGFYLQMPPQGDTYTLPLREANEKL